MSEYTECDEVADAMTAPRGSSFDECVAIVRQQIPDETETVIDNTAFALYQKAKAGMDLQLLTAPENWTSYLINGDASGLDSNEIALADK